MLGKTKEERLLDGERIQKNVLKRSGIFFGVIILVCIFMLQYSILIQHCPCFRKIIYNCLKAGLDHWGLREAASIAKMQIKLHLNEWSDFIVTYHTLIVSVVVFFFSIMDNRKEGIYHRRIMAYTYGSYMIPGLFVISIVEVFIIFISKTFDWKTMMFSAIICAYVVQVICMFICLLATSFRQAVRAICNVEIRQFKYLSNTSEQKKMTNEMLTMPSEKWAFLMRHIEHSLRSDDLMDDKMMLVQKLVRVPYYKSEKNFGKHRVNSKQLSELHPDKLYEYYYNNLLAAFNTLNELGHSEDRMKFFVILYDFINELSQEYNKLIQQGIINKRAQHNYHITISAIMNAALYADMEESETFCNYILKNCMTEAESKHNQLCYYLMYQELLYRTNREAVKLNTIENVSDMLKNGKVSEQLPYEMFWDVWKTYGSTLEENSSRQYLWDALSTMFDISRSSVPISYALNKIRLRGEST